MSDLLIVSSSSKINFMVTLKISLLFPRSIDISFTVDVSSIGTFFMVSAISNIDLMVKLQH